MITNHNKPNSVAYDIIIHAVLFAVLILGIWGAGSGNGAGRFFGTIGLILVTFLETLLITLYKLSIDQRNKLSIMANYVDLNDQLGRLRVIASEMKSDVKGGILTKIASSEHHFNQIDVGIFEHWLDSSYFDLIKIARSYERYTMGRDLHDAVLNMVNDAKLEEARQLIDAGEELVTRSNRSSRFRNGAGAEAIATHAQRLRKLATQSASMEHLEAVQTHINAITPLVATLEDALPKLKK